MMLDKIFCGVLSLSLAASFAIILVIFARLLLKGAPKRFSYVMWSIVLLRLLIPFSIESPVSLMPVRGQVFTPELAMSPSPAIDSGSAAIDAVVNRLLPAAEETCSVNPLQIIMTIGEFVWLLGIAVLLFCNLAALVRLRQRLVGAVRSEDNIYLADHIGTAFVLGIFRPRIYLPSDIGESERGYIIEHERTHIRRCDHIIKPVMFAALLLHWFNPMVWLAFRLAVRDMEMSCDEAVLRRSGDIRKRYCESLLLLASGKPNYTASPLAFGEGGAKERIINVMNYKKPSAWMNAAAVIVTAAVITACAAAPGGSKVSEVSFTTHDSTDLTLELELPDGWEIRSDSPELPYFSAGGAFEACAYIYDGSEYIGTIGCNPYELYDGWENMDDAAFANMIYSFLRLGAHYTWDGFEPVYKNASAVVSLPTVYTQIPDDSISAAAWDQIYLVGIAAYSNDKPAYVCIEFAEGAVTDEQREAIAESIVLK